MAPVADRVPFPPMHPTGAQSRKRLLAALVALVATPTAASAQWRVLDAHTTADLVTVSAVDDRIAWVAGANGTARRTEDGGLTWQTCAVPTGAERETLGSIQAFDERTAVVLASRPGGGSAIYRTADGCRSWQEVLRPAASGVSLRSVRRSSWFDVYALGDPVDGRFALFESHDAGKSWVRSADAGLETSAGQRSVAGGSMALTNVLSEIAFATRGGDAAIYAFVPVCREGGCTLKWRVSPTPLARDGAESGAASVAGRNVMVQGPAAVTGVGTAPATTLVAVGGNPAEPDKAIGTAAYSADGGASWKRPDVGPAGYRTAVAFDGERGRFIAVGPNGTDVTVDDGLVWQPLRGRTGSSMGNMGQGWIAISAPFAVGPRGRVGRLTDVP